MAHGGAQPALYAGLHEATLRHQVGIVGVVLLELGVLAAQVGQHAPGDGEQLREVRCDDGLGTGNSPEKADISEVLQRSEKNGLTEHLNASKNHDKHSISHLPLLHNRIPGGKSGVPDLTADSSQHQRVHASKKWVCRQSTTIDAQEQSHPQKRGQLIKHDSCAASHLAATHLVLKCQKLLDFHADWKRNSSPRHEDLHEVDALTESSIILVQLGHSLHHGCN
mmetsp:Transcript_86266/g.231079  ORF Transcript_86266/g.231079 Transcript_86266/m.231079 type:complete len:223 (-) Transcript_86266:1108-1776(-)